MMYQMFGIYTDEIDIDFEGVNDFIGKFFIAFGNGVGNFRPPTWSKGANPGVNTMILVYVIWFLNMIFMSILLLNYVITLIFEVY
jgi:hypothetical protein